jgi:hypothetical protein
MISLPLKYDYSSEMQVRWSDYCLLRGMGEKPSPLGEDFSRLAVLWKITVRRRIRFTT